MSTVLQGTFILNRLVAARMCRFRCQRQYMEKSVASNGKITTEMVFGTAPSSAFLAGKFTLTVPLKG